ncbi:MAG: mepM [Chthonomonadaceae bacterium]|nr:mepM [Chthonomonadaceae bacterium]
MRNQIHVLKAFVLLLLGLSLSSAARADDKNVMLYKVNKGSSISLMARLTQCSEATVTFTATVENMASSVSLPQTVELTGPKTIVLAVFTPIDPNIPCSCIGSYTWEYGRRLASPPAAYTSYTLPYHNGPYEVIQGAHGAFSHSIGTSDAEAIDWAMPIGTPVYPARSGVVIGIRTDCIIGGPDKKWMLDCNYVIVKHDDGTMAEYLHLQHNGVLVHLGDHVTPDRSIALSGNTGYTTEPHLHFAVFVLEFGTTTRSLPLTFQRRNGSLYTLFEGSFY